MESNFKLPIYIISKHQSNEYWKQWLSEQTVPTAVFYREDNNTDPIMIQKIEQIPDFEVLWLEPIVADCKLIPVRERPLFDLEWLEREIQIF